MVAGGLRREMCDFLWEMNQKATDAKPTRKQRIHTGSAADEFSMAAALVAVFSKLHFFCVQKIAELRTALEVVTFLPSGFRVWGVLVTDLIGDCHGQRVHPIHFNASPHLSKCFKWILYQVCVTGQAFWLMLANVPSVGPIYKGVESMRRSAKS